MKVGAIVAGLLISTVIALACGGGTAATKAQDRHTEIRAVGCHGAEPALGSGTAVAAETVLTVAHVVAGADTVIVTDAAGDDREATLIAIDTRLDLAVLDVPGLDVTSVALSSLAAGDSGAAQGLGTAGELRWKVERTVTIRFGDIYGNGVHERAGYELQASVEHGDSGAGLFAGDSSLGGVIFAASQRDPDRAWATDIAAAAAILATAGEADPPDPADVACAEPAPGR